MRTSGARWSRPALVVGLYLGLSLAGLLWSALRGHSFVWRMQGREDPQSLTGAAAGLLMGLGLVFVWQLAVHRFDWARALHRDFRARLRPLDGTDCLVFAGASALGEEIFFRGALLPVAGLWWSNIAFALLHVGPKGRYLPWTGASLLTGVLLGQLTLWSGDLTGAVVAHFTVNFLNLRHLARHELP
jgi:membrane protease YdiL (CAAX protease family)